MSKYRDVTQQRFGKLTALFLEFRDKHKQAHWMCVCDCGEYKSVNLQALTSGATRSCGCYNRMVASALRQANKLAEIHGLSKHPLYGTWATMKQRCSNPRNKKYPLYGERGIKVCDRWMNSFPNFLEDMGESPEGASLNRINNDGDYEPGNCEWSSISEQNKNRRRYKRNSTGLFNEIGG